MPVAPSASPPAPQFAAAQPCRTAEVTIAFDFEGASAARCVIEGPRAFTLLIGPEHAPPINPSPWYAFRYAIEPGPDVTIRLEYLEARHRYVPKRISADRIEALPTEVSEDGQQASFTLSPGTGRVAAEELFDAARYHRLLDELRRYAFVETMTVGHSREGRPIEALRMGKSDAPKMIVLLGRAHPPEVSGAIAMETFLAELAEIYSEGGIDPAKVQVFAVPLLNPDGVARGHWRANLGGLDLNRDWGEFSQPETRAVADWLDALDPSISLVTMIDFHSTQTNLFYVQGEGETTPDQERFLRDWLGQRDGRIESYPFTIERRNANPGSGTSKNWFHATYAIPAYTYEVADEADREAVVAAARIFARALPAAVADLTPGKGAN